jgi:transposase
MFYVGIDIAKRSHQAAIVDDKGSVIVKPFSFANTVEGCQKVLAALTKVNAPKDEVIVAMEATGHYWLNVYSFFIEYDFNVKVVNPIQSDSFRDLSIRKCKTDSIDCVLIAELIRFGKYSSCSVPDETLVAIKNLSRYRFYVVDSCADLKRKAIALLDQVFPEYDSLFSDIFGITSRELLMKFTIPEEFLDVSATKLANFISKASKGRLGRNKAEQIQSAAQNSFGLKYATDSFAFQLRMILEQIDFAEKQLDELDREVNRLLESAGGLILTTITGFGATLAAAVYGELGEISKFDSPKKIVAYAGIDASIVQSGQFLGTQSKISKRGSPYLRRALFLAANVAAFKDPALSVYYAQKIAQGKHHKQAVLAVARKLCNIIWAVWNSKKPYEPRLN